ncbi:hypothetical protein D3C73_1206510 [compost metagenome]
MAGSQRFSAKKRDIIQKYDLARLVHDLLEGGRNADLEDLAHKVPGQLQEISQLRLQLHDPVQHPEEHDQRQPAAENRRDRGSAHSHLRKAEMAENQRIIANDMNDIHSERNEHRFLRKAVDPDNG